MDTTNNTTQSKAANASRPCRKYASGAHCATGLDHCFNCGRHLDETTQECPKGCGSDEDTNDSANNEE